MGELAETLKPYPDAAALIQTAARCFMAKQKLRGLLEVGAAAQGRVCVCVCVTVDSFCTSLRSPIIITPRISTRLLDLARAGQEEAGGRRQQISLKVPTRHWPLV
jgi:hypothetical protein